MTDETVGIDPATGIIHPYPKPLLLRTGDPHKAEVSPDEMGLVGAHPRQRVARVILLARPAGHTGEPEIEELGLLDAEGETLTREDVAPSVVARVRGTRRGTTDQLEAHSRTGGPNEEAQPVVTVPAG